jgi:hypothetical protein
MTKKINFRAIDKFGFETQIKPEPAKNFLPEWWRKMDAYTNEPGKKGLTMSQGRPNMSPKKCTPMLDSLTSGYIISLWSDVWINSNDETFEVDWKTQRPVFEKHGSDTVRVETPEGYHAHVLKYLNTWIPETPKGYSLLVTSPFGYKNLPFQAVPAIIDTDKSTLDIVPPMWIKKNFSGVVEKGTPLIQLIPFKRDDWEATHNYYEDGEFSLVQEKNFNSTIISHYIKQVWSKKSYK